MTANPIMPIQWLSAMKTCTCLPCISLVRAWNLTTDEPPAGMRSEIPFTEGDIQMLELLVEGRSNAQIARALNLSRARIKNHMSQLMISLGLHSRLQLALFALAIGLVARQSPVGGFDDGIVEGDFAE